ncbi:MAG: nuclease A inhibitor family protein [Chlorobi bacterium]|nr:nuclease A inhibitor family protein [Chlorobiota bacterium]
MSNQFSSAAELYRRLDELTADLMYPSETDAPIGVMMWDTSERGSLTVDAVMDYFGIPSDSPISKVPPEDFFDGVIETYPWQNEQERRHTAQYQQARDLFFANVTAPKHYWIGEYTVEVFLWGRTRDGNYIILHTRIVET